MPSVPRSLLLVYGAHGVNGLLSALTIPAAVGLLGFSGYGLFSIYSFIATCILMGDLGIGKNLLRHLSSRREAPVETLRVAFTLYVLIAAAWLAISPLAAELVSRVLFAVPVEHITQLKWLTFLAFLEFAVSVPISLLQTSAVAAQRFEAYARFSVVTGILRNLAIISAAFVFRSPLAIAVVLVGKRLIDVLLAAHFFGGLPAAVWKPHVDIRAFRAMLGQSTTLSVATVLNATIPGLASALVNAAYGLSGLGVYRSAADLASKIAFLSNGISLVAFPHASQHLGKGAGPIMTHSRAYDLTAFSTILYACVGGAAVISAPVILPLLRLQDQTTIGLFSLLIVGLSTNAHSTLANEIVQAAGRYRLSIHFSVTTVVALLLSFHFLKTFVGIFAIGWAWVLAAFLGAGLIDACLLSLCEASPTQQAKALLLKVFSTAACLGMATFQFGMTGRFVAFCSASLLIAMLLLSVWRTLPHILQFAKAGYPSSRPIGTYA